MIPTVVNSVQSVLRSALWYRQIFCALLPVLLVCSCSDRAGGRQSEPVETPTARVTVALPIAGVTIADDFPDYTSDANRRLCDSLSALGVQWAAIVASGYLHTTDATDIRSTRWSQRDYIQGIRLIRRCGLRVLFKPYLWSHEFWTKKTWTGVIAQPDSGRRRQWFASYTAWMLDNARYAEEGGADMLCIGLELPGMSIYEHEWRELIRAVREVYSGALVYAAHGAEEARAIRFWDALDAVGVNVYPTLSRSANPTADDLRRGWQPYKKEFAQLARQLDRPVIFTEAGFRSVVGAAYKPWEWPEHANRPVSMEQQQLAYRILAEECYDEPWFGGIFWWKLFTDPQRNEGPDGFTPQGKPAFAQMVRDFRVLAATAE